MIGFLLVLLGIPLSAWIIGEYLGALKKGDDAMIFKSKCKIIFLLAYIYFAGMCSL